MEEKFTVFIPKTYRKVVYKDKLYNKGKKTITVDYKEAIVNRIAANANTKSFIEHCILDVKSVSKKQLENMFNKGFILIRMSSTENILNYREHIKRGFNLIFMSHKEYQNLRKQFMEVVKNG